MKGCDMFGVLLFSGLFIFGIALVMLIVPKQLDANRLCIENGYPHAKLYTDGSIFCERKGDMGKDEIVRIK